MMATVGVKGLIKVCSVSYWLRQPDIILHCQTLIIRA